MRVSIGSDHRGFNVKAKLINLLAHLGHEVVDEGTSNTESVDYPDIASVVGSKVSRGEVERGILVCGTGIGMSIAANKFPGVRAATCHDEITAEISRRHNDVNVLCLSGDLLGERPIDNLVKIWLSTQFEGGRHARRLQKIAKLEERDATGCKSPPSPQ
jgi:ribose 5-phosphate isomerase B